MDTNQGLDRVLSLYISVNGERVLLADILPHSEQMRLINILDSIAGQDEKEENRL